MRKKVSFINKNKKTICVLVLILLIIILYFMTKKQKNGNNMNSLEIVDRIINLNSYKAKVCVHINSNKSQNRYILRQEYDSENGSVQEVIEPENISGIKITKKENNLKLENSNLDLKTLFENNNGLENNCLDLINFVNEYREKSKSSYEENDVEIVMKVKSNKANNYIENKKLYIDKEKALPKKLVIQDNNQNTTIIIEYIEVELN